MKNGIHETTEYLELFLRNLLCDEKNELYNRSMHISGIFDLNEKVDIETKKPDIEARKMDIQTQKPDIKAKKADIRETCAEILPNISNKTIEYIVAIYKKYGNEQFFGRSNIEALVGLKSSRVSELLKLLYDHGIIEPVKGHGKGKYRFCGQFMRILR